MAVPGSPHSPEPPIQVPPLVKDPVASLCPWPVAITLIGQDYEIPAHPAATWLEILMPEGGVQLEDIIPGMLDADEARELEDAIWDGSLLLDDMHRMSLKVIGTASGRDWHVAMKLIAAASASWNTMGGEFVLRGLDATKLSLAAWLDAVYLLLLRNMDNKEAMMFNAKLQIPPAGFEDEEAEEDTLTTEAFMAMDLD